MPMRVLKYEMPAPGKSLSLVIPGGTWLEVGHIGIQDERIFFWTPVVQGEKDRIYHFFTVGTGWPVDLEAQQYLGTVQDGEGFVWHVFASYGDEATDG